GAAQPEQLWAMLAMTLPGAGSNAITPGPDPVALPGTASLLPFGGQLYVAASSDVLGVGMGQSAHSMLSRGVAEGARGSDQYSISMRADRGWLETLEQSDDDDLAEVLEAVSTDDSTTAGEKDKQLDMIKQLKEAQRALDRAKAELYGDLVINGFISSRGLIIEFAQYYREPAQ
ncbi:MAG: hypothetical protein AAGC55_08935, partial [Myxococcota bacterium]